MKQTKTPDTWIAINQECKMEIWKQKDTIIVWKVE